MRISQAGAPLGALDAAVARGLLRKRRRLDTELLSSLAVTNGDVLAALPPPIPSSELEPLWAYAPDLLHLPPPVLEPRQPPYEQPPVALPEGVTAAVAAGTARAYVGRCGRVVVARCDPLTLEPLQPPIAAAVADGSAADGGRASSVPPTAGASSNIKDSSLVPDGLLHAFHTPPPAAQPWALAFDLELLPEHIDRAPIVAARQSWAALQRLLGCEPGEVVRVAGGDGEAGGDGGMSRRFPPWATPRPVLGGGRMAGGQVGGAGVRVSLPGNSAAAAAGGGSNGVAVAAGQQRPSKGGGGAVTGRAGSLAPGRPAR